MMACVMAVKQHFKFAGVIRNVIETGPVHGPSVRMSLMDLPHRPKGPELGFVGSYN